MNHATRTIRKLGIVSALVGCLTLVSGVALAAKDTSAFGGKCVSCHESTVKEFGATNHAKVAGATGKKMDCESCHGNASQHVMENTKESIITFGKESKRSAEEQSKQCLSCHSKTPALAMWQMGAHKKNDVSCASCHSVHKPDMVKTPETCFSCHANVKSQVGRPSHHPVIEGKVSCSDCHDTHGALSHGQLKADNVNQLCYKCHGDKRGPFMWEHAPVEENCLNCHSPHGSNHRDLLVKRSPQLCLDCHRTGHGQAVIGNNRTFKPGQAFASQNRFLMARDCLSCHGKIHGSNGPGGKPFVR